MNGKALEAAAARYEQMIESGMEGADWNYEEFTAGIVAAYLDEAGTPTHYCTTHKCQPEWFGDYCSEMPGGGCVITDAVLVLGGSE